MSRVDDDRESARVAERLAQAKRAEETRSKDKAGEASNFSKLVQEQKTTQQQLSGQKAKAQTQESTGAAKSAIAKMLSSKTLGDQNEKHVDGHKSEGTRNETTHAESRAGSRSLGEKLNQSAKQAVASESDVTGRVKESSDQGQAQTSTAQSADRSLSSSRADGRGQDAQTSNARLDERKESSDNASSKMGGAGGARAEKGDLKTDADKGGQQGGSDKGGGEPAAASTFRFNPALMAPVSVQKKNETQSSDKLRKAAAEIAQKIVERVRVGTNATGKMEFQIDLKNDVLGGLSVKVSSKNGKITAVFSGSDRDVLKMLEDQSESLKTALSARGLTLETLKTEAKV